MACAAPSESGAGGETASDDLIGGAAADPVASMYLATGCTATRVGDRVVLTAAHCVVKDGGGLRSEYVDGASFAFQRNWRIGNGPYTWLRVEHVIVDEGYAGASQGLDYAIIVTQQSLDASIPIAMVDLDPVNEGEQVLLAGYGCNERVERVARETKDFDVGYSAVTKVEDRYIVTNGPATGGGAGVCPGDSGGPLFRGGAIVGVNSLYWERDQVTTKSAHARVDETTHAGQRLAESGAAMCRSSEGSCTSHAPKWIAGRLTVFDKCIVPEGDGTENGTPLVIAPCNEGDPRQRWTIRPDRTIVHEATGRCFDLAAPQGGAPFHLWDCHGGENQRFSQGEGGTLMDDQRICVDAAGGSSEVGTPLIGWGCHGQKNQQIGYWF